MEDIAVVLMMKNDITGFLEKELGAYRISENENLILNMFAVKEHDDIYVHINVSTDRDVKNWEFSAIYDYYDVQTFIDSGYQVNEVTDCYNPTWEVVFQYVDDVPEMEKIIRQVISLHKTELEDVYEAIKELECEYSDN